MKKYFSLISLSLVFASLNATTYYVSTSGNNGNAGTLASPWRTLTYAAGNSSPVTVGDTVFVKAGSYTSENVVCTKVGVPANRIVFMGYTSSPGDSPTLLVTQANPYASYNTAVMPTYTGSNRNTGIGFDLTASRYVDYLNFQITAYAIGVVTGSSDTLSSHIYLYNVNCTSIGDITSSYSGKGISMGTTGTTFSDQNKISHCLVTNCAAEGITLNGDYNYLEYSQVWCNENTSNASCDYYVTIYGNHNTVDTCLINRSSSLSLVGHGFSIKDNREQWVDAGTPTVVITCKYNKIMRCKATNMGECFAFRHRDVQYNIVWHCYATGTHTGSGSSGMGGGASIRDGASWNIIDGLKVDSCASGISFDDTVEDGDTGGSPPGHPGNNNKIINSVFANCYTPVKFSIDGGIASDAGDNEFANCTFYLTRYLFYCARRCTTMRFNACIFYGNSAVGSGGYFSGNTYASDIVASMFKYCCFFNQQGGMPGGFVAGTTGGITSNPLFTNAGTRNFHLTSSSPCINAAGTVDNAVAATPALPYCRVWDIRHNDLIWGCNTKYHRVSGFHVNRDYDGVVCPVGNYFDMGAFEYH